MNPLLEKPLKTRTHLDVCDSSGSHETPGQFDHGDFNSDIVDLDVVVKHLMSTYGYVVTMIVSHSKGSKVAMRYLCTHGDIAADVKCFVNVAGRYRMVRSLKCMFGALIHETLARFFTPQRVDRGCHFTALSRDDIDLDPLQMKNCIQD